MTTFTGTSVQRFALGLTSRHNLSALVTCHTLYVVFTTWQSAVFLVNSRLTHFTATGSISATLSMSTDAGGTPIVDVGSKVWLLRSVTFSPNHRNGAGTPSSEVTGLD